MNITITRDYKETCTPGKMQIGGAIFATMERARNGNHPCIPEGTYMLVPRHSPVHGDVYAFIGGVCYESEVPQGEEGRCLILLHSANTASELLGCVAPGLAAGFFGQERAVLHSKAAMSAIKELLKNDSHQVTITR